MSNKTNQKVKEIVRKMGCRLACGLTCGSSDQDADVRVNHVEVRIKHTDVHMPGNYKNETVYADEDANIVWMSES